MNDKQFITFEYETPKYRNKAQVGININQIEEFWVEWGEDGGVYIKMNSGKEYCFARREGNKSWLKFETTGYMNWDALDSISSQLMDLHDYNDIKQ